MPAVTSTIFDPIVQHKHGLGRKEVFCYDNNLRSIIIFLGATLRHPDIIKQNAQLGTQNHKDASYFPNHAKMTQ